MDQAFKHRRAGDLAHVMARCAARWLGAFVGLDLSASSAWTRKALDWTPTGSELLDDLKRMDFSA